MEFLRRHRKIIVIVLTVLLVVWMVGLTTIIGVLAYK